MGAVLGQSRAHSTSADSSLLYTMVICNSAGPVISSPRVSFIFLVLSLLGRALDWARFKCKGRREELWGHIASGQSFLHQNNRDKFYIAESCVASWERASPHAWGGALVLPKGR